MTKMLVKSEDGRGPETETAVSVGRLRLTALGFLTMISGLSIINYIMTRPDIFPKVVAHAAQFSPLWLAGLIGWAVASSGGNRGGSASTPVLIAVLLSVPVALLDPWAIVSLRMGDGPHMAVRLLLLSAPLGMAALFAYPAPDRERAAVVRRFFDLLAMVAVTAVIYYSIYALVLPKY